MVPVSIVWLLVIVVMGMSAALVYKHAVATSVWGQSYFTVYSSDGKRERHARRRVTRRVKKACAAFEQVNPYANVTEAKKAILNIEATISKVSDIMTGFYSEESAYFIDQERSLLRGLIASALLQSGDNRSLLSVVNVAKGSVTQVTSFIEETISGDQVPLDLSEAIRGEISWFLLLNNKRLTDKIRLIKQ